MIKKMMSLGLLAVAWAAWADIREGYRDLRSQTGAGSTYVLADGLFASGADGWSNIDGGAVRVEPNGGVNGSPALRYERTDAEAYCLVSRALTLKPGRSYRFGGVIRNENVNGAGGNIILEVYNPDGSFRRNQDCPTSAGSNSDWTPLEYTFEVKPDETDCTFVLHLYMPRGSTGIAWFDRVYVAEAAPAWQLSQTFPTHNTVEAVGGPLRFFSQFRGVVDGAVAAPRLEVEAQLQVADRREEAVGAVVGNTVEVAFGEMPVGTGVLRTRLYDTANRMLLAEQSRPVEVRDRFASAGANACVIDRDGRALVGGRPFLPLGLYTGRLTRQDIDRIAASPFNCVMPYPSMELDFEPSRERKVEALLDRVAASLDYLNERDVKIIFSLKDVFRSNPLQEDDYTFRDMSGADRVVELYVNRFKQHPALLAWYTCDERMVDWVPLMTERRQLVNRLDPDHPTWAVFYQPNVADYLPMLDIFGGDQYPISRISEGFDHHMTSIDRLMGLAEATGVPTWNVPQAHNLNIYAPLAQAQDYRDPTGEEMLTLALVQAIHGGKGFVFYSYFDFSRGANGAEAEALFDRRWQEACMAAGELEKLAPYLLSGAPEPRITIETESGKLRARCFADGQGKFRLVIAGVGPGTTAGRIRVELPEGLDFHSRTGLTERAAANEFVFRGHDICSDIITLE